MITKARIPDTVARVVAKELGYYYYSHRSLETLFLEAGAPEEIPEGSCVVKCESWLKRASEDDTIDAHGVLGRVLEYFMDEAAPKDLESPDEFEKRRQKIRDVLARFGFTYHQGGRILGGVTGAPTRSLEALLRSRDVRGMEVEFERALGNVLKDPAASITAASSIVEALCKIYIQDEGLEAPKDQTIKPLWKVVQNHLDLDPALVEDDDLKRILSGLVSVVDGVGALRTHIGSAHGRGRKTYKVEPRHARLAVHSAHSLVAFVLETWGHRKLHGMEAANQPLRRPADFVIRR